MKTIVYIDGFNLQYGLLRDVKWRWLDLEEFSRALLTPKYEITAIKYFTARVKSDPNLPALPNDQARYLDAISGNPLIKVIEGSYKRFRVKLPFAKEPCISCEKVKYATVWKTEEKKSDVNLAVEMTADAYENAADAFVLVSGDSDHAAALALARYRHKKTTVVFNPHKGECIELRRLSTFYKSIPHDLPAQCQLPDTVMGASGKVIRRPSSWISTPGIPQA